MKQLLSSLLNSVYNNPIKYTTLNNIMKFFKAERKTKYQCIDKPHQIISRWGKKPNQILHHIILWKTSFPVKLISHIINAICVCGFQSCKSKIKNYKANQPYHYFTMFKTLRKTQQLWITSKRNCLKNDEKKNNPKNQKTKRQQFNSHQSKKWMEFLNLG